jgi:serine/threonine-protein kinase RsbW
VRHSADAKALTIAARCSGGTVLLTVEDDGGAFNPLSVPEPDRPAALGDAVLGGQGIPLIKRLSTSVSYDRIGTLNSVTALLTLK